MGSGVLARRLLEEAFVSIVPGKDFGQHRNDDHLRISYASSVEQIIEATDRIGRFLQRA